MLNNLGLKKISLILTGAAMVCFGLAALLFFNIDVKDFKSNKYLYEVNQEQSFDVGNIKDINIDSFSSDINIIDTDDNKVKVHIYGKLYAKSKVEVNNPVIELDNGKLDIRESKKGKIYIGINLNIGNLFNKNETKIDLYIPESYREDIKIASSSGNITAAPLNIKKLNIDTFSGKIVLSGVTADTVQFETSSGDIKADNIKADNIKINSFSGKSEFKELNAVKLSFESSSGDLSLGAAKTENTTLDTFSGKITAEALEADDANVSTSSGKIVIDMAKFKNVKCESFSGDVFFSKAELKDTDIKTSSGNVAIKLGENSEFALDADSSSGNVSCEFPVDSIEEQGKHRIKGIVGKADSKIKIETFSGNIRISR